MRKITFLLLGLLLSAGASATITTKQLTLTGGWGNTKLMTGAVNVNFDSQWGEFKICTDNFSIADYPTFKITYSGASKGMQLKVQNKTLVDAGKYEGQYIDIDTTATELTGTFDTTKFGTDNVITTFNIQGKDTGAKINIKDVVLIKADGTQKETNYASVWGTSTVDYSGTYVFTKQWAQLGGWTTTMGEGETHTYTLKLNKPAPANFQFKVDTPESYIAIPAGTTETSLVFTKAYNNISIQYTGTANDTISIASLTCKIAKTTITGSTDIYTGDAVDMGNWTGHITVGADQFTNAKINDIILVTFSNAASGAQIGLRSNSEGWPTLDQNTKYASISNTTYQYTITADSVLTKLKNAGLIIQGHDFTVTKVTLETTDDSYTPTPTAINTTGKTSAELVETTVYNVAGQQNAKLVKGINIVRQRLNDGTVKVKKVLVR